MLSQDYLLPPPRLHHHSHPLSLIPEQESHSGLTQRHLPSSQIVYSLNLALPRRFVDEAVSYYSSSLPTSAAAAVELASALMMSGLSDGLARVDEVVKKFRRDTKTALVAE